jgi:hypothetical protein
MIVFLSDERSEESKDLRLTLHLLLLLLRSPQMRGCPGLDSETGDIDDFTKPLFS